MATPQLQVEVLDTDDADRPTIRLEASTQTKKVEPRPEQLEFFTEWQLGEGRRSP